MIDESNSDEVHALADAVDRDCEWNVRADAAVALRVLVNERDALASEVLKLRALLARYRDETPLGHQPHMIAGLADEALGRR